MKKYLYKKYNMNVLLVSEDYVKTHSEISNNLYGQYLLPAIRSAQDMGLQPIIGERLYDKIISIVGDGSITASTNTYYKELLDDKIQPYLLEKIIADLIPIVSTKIANLGNVVTYTEKYEKIVTLNESEIIRLSNYHTEKADFYARRMQEYLINNFEHFPELKEDELFQINANLDSAASTGLWLGGVRSDKLHFSDVLKRRRDIYRIYDN